MKQFLLLLVLLLSATAQTPTPSDKHGSGRSGSSIRTLPRGLGASASISKDIRAATVLRQMLRVTGWNRENSLRDAILAGTITRHLGDQAENSSFTLKLRGDEQYDYTEVGSSRLVANGPVGAIVDRDGKARRIASQSALSSRFLILPLSQKIADWDGPDVSLAFLGESAVEGETCVGVQIEPIYADDKDHPLGRARRLVAPVVLWISTSRFVPLRADYYRASTDNHNGAIAETAVFSEYRAVGKIAVPFTEQISVDGQKMYTLTFSSVDFNQGLADRDFDVAVLLGGVR